MTRSVATACGSILIVFILTCVAQASEPAGHRFIYQPPDPAEQVRSVAVAGTFNGWSRDANPMTRNADGAWETTIDLPDGIHLYKFVVNGDQWYNDPASDTELEQPDGHGGVNSAVLIGFDPRTLPAPQPNAINPDALRHDPTRQQCRMVLDVDLLLLSIDAQLGDVQGVTVHVEGQDGGWSAHQLQREGETFGMESFGSVIPTPRGTVRYVFELTDGSATAYLTPAGLADSLDSARSDAYEVEMAITFHTPDWAKHAVWYQVFPERFRNGDTGNDPGEQRHENLVRWQADWWQTQPGEASGEENFFGGEGNVWKRRYGGDIQGVREALPYLRRLGVTAIYFNPVFEADSMHKYDTTDYRHIDDNFGVKGDLPIEGETDDPATWQWSPSDRVFLEFIEEAHRQGFKVIIDGVFNHTGRSHYAFQDVLAHGQDSPYADWFEITSWGSGGAPGTPDGMQWSAWDGPNGYLPVFKKDPVHGLVDGPRQHIFAITRRWMAPDGDPSKGIDGWRLDVPGDIPHPFWIEWRKVVKNTHPDAYITGEIWTWAQPWLQGDQFDAVMNYRFAQAAQDFFVDRKTAIPPTEFARVLQQIAYTYPMQVTLVQQNLFDSHDTDRLASMFVNPDRPYDGQNRQQDNGPGYDPRKPNALERTRMMQAVAFQMTFIGAPMIYYGDEAGMWGPDDPSNRMPMIWQDLEPYDDSTVTFDPGMYEHYQKLIAIRRALRPLQAGTFRTVLADDENGLFAFCRTADGENVYVVFNRSDREQQATFPVSGEQRVANLLEDDVTSLSIDRVGEDARPAIVIQNAAWITPDDGQVTQTLPAYGTAILAEGVPGGAGEQ